MYCISVKIGDAHSKALELQKAVQDECEKLESGKSPQWIPMKSEEEKILCAEAEIL